MMTADRSGARSTLVVAVRGTASLIDWLVNLDGEPMLVGDFLVRAVAPVR